LKLFRASSVVLWMLFAACASAQQMLEIIPLRHSTIDQVLPALRPFLEPGGTLTGQSGQLIVRASPENIAELRRVLETIDRPLRRLMISVRFDDAGQDSRRALEAGGTISNRRSEIEVRAQDSSSRAEERVNQRLQVMEGGRAFIVTGQSRSAPQRQFIQTPAGVVSQEIQVIQETASGFEVVPRVTGERVFLDIAPQRERYTGPGAAAGVESQRLSSSVSGRLGEWFEIGGAAESSARDDRGLASSRASTGSRTRAVWVKVEELR
jgi:hypothetical protein